MEKLNLYCVNVKFPVLAISADGARECLDELLEGFNFTGSEPIELFSSENIAKAAKFILAFDAISEASSEIDKLTHVFCEHALGLNVEYESREWMVLFNQISNCADLVRIHNSKTYLCIEKD